MKQIRLVFILLTTSVITYNCQDVDSSKNEVEENSVERIQDVNGDDIPTQEELAAQNEALMANLLAPEDFNIQLDNGEKWEVEPESLKMLLQIKQQIYVISGNMENYTIDSYKMLGDEVHEFSKTIGAINDANANKEFKKVITETQNQCLFLMGSDLKQAQLAVINLSILYDEVPKYFKATEK